MVVILELGALRRWSKLALCECFIVWRMLLNFGVYDVFVLGDIEAPPPPPTGIGLASVGIDAVKHVS